MTTVTSVPVSMEKPRLSPRRRRSRMHPFRIATAIIVAALVVVQVYPLAWLFMTSLKTESDFVHNNPFALPSSISFDNYARAFSVGDLGMNIVNSLIVTLGASVAIVVFGMMAAYALQVLGFRGSKAVKGLFLLGIVVPVQIALVPLFIDYASIGMLDTHLSMIIPLAGFAFPLSVYLFSSFFEYIPDSIYEAASIDGAGPYRVFWAITMPLSTNTIVTVVLVNSIFIWNDFIFGNTFVLSDDLKTIPLGLQNYIGAMGNVDWTATFAAVCVTVTPLLLVFLVLNKAIIYGIEGGANKG